MPTQIERLEVYQQAVALGDAVWALVGRWAAFDRDTLGKQLVRSADSVAANLAEGAGRWSKNELRHFAYIARGSLYETIHWLTVAHTRGLLTDDERALLRPLVQRLPPMLNAFLRALKTPPPAASEPPVPYGDEDDALPPTLPF